MHLKRVWGIFACLSFIITLLPVTTTVQAQSTRPDLFYLAPDAGGILQVWSLGSTDTITQISQETANITAYAVAPNNTVAYVTARSLSTGATVLTTGGPLDNANMQLADVAWSPSGNRLAVVAISTSGQADPSEGIWLLDTATNSWTLTLTSSRSDPANSLIYSGVAWGASGDRLVVEVDFSPTTGASGVYSLSTGQSQLYSLAGTNNQIDSNGYSRGNMSNNGTSIILSDVPERPTGAGYVVDVNDYTRIIPLVGDEYANRYLSHAIPIDGGTAFFIRDFGNNITTSEVWQLSYSGSRVALGSIPHAALGFEASWTNDGLLLAYVNDPDVSTGLGNLNVYSRVNEAMEAVTLTTAIPQAKNPQWGSFVSLTGLATVNQVVMTEPLIAFLDEAGVRYYATRMQWNAVAGTDRYRLSITPGFDGVTTFDVQGTAAKFNRMPCATTFTISVAAYDATGLLTPDSVPSTLSTPSCTSQIAPVVTDLYTGAAAPAPITPPVTGIDTTTTTTQPAAPTVAAPPVGNTTTAPAGADAAVKVTTLVAGLPVQEGTAPDGKPAYYSDLSWSQPAPTVNFFIVEVSPAFGADQRNRLNTRFEGTNPIVARLSGLTCGQNYTVTIQSIGENGFDVLAVSEPVTVSTPFCPQ